MAYVAFDLDNTLGFFEYTNPLAFFWSPEMLTNPEQARVNRGARFSPRLLGKLAAAREAFLEGLAANRPLLFKILRPNLDTLIRPLLRLRDKGVLASVIFYSNSGVTPSLQLAKDLIERHYKAPGLIEVLADHWHPLRTEDRRSPGNQKSPVRQYIEPQKTVGTLKKLFRSTGAGGSKRSTTIPSDQILFVDDRQPKHMIESEEVNGLTYLVPTPYTFKLQPKDAKALLELAFAAMDSAGLLKDQEYLASAFCHRKIPYDFIHTHKITGFESLVGHIIGLIEGVQVPAEPWVKDTQELSRAMQAYTKKFSPV